MYEIIYLPVAKQDILENMRYISDVLKSPKAANDLLDELDHSISLLEELPYAHKIYRPVKPLEDEYHMLQVKNYAVIYVVIEQQKRVEIRRIIYAKMDLNKIIKEN